ncbi:hypothetical protein [Streptomyces cinereoruber]|uniref:hypothetical protein n=1 Tax=Streptomyces cinereoruber TaxID=67260 RepID=UPI003625E01B
MTYRDLIVRGQADFAFGETVVICGSTRFMREMADADRELTWHGYIVLKPGCNMKEPHELWADPKKAEAGKACLDALHRLKIDRACWVLVVNPDGYIGDSTKREIAYAEARSIPVKYTHPPVNAAQ